MKWLYTEYNDCRSRPTFIHSFIPVNSGSKAHKTTGENYTKEYQTENRQSSELTKMHNYSDSDKDNDNFINNTQKNVIK